MEVNFNDTVKKVIQIADEYFTKGDVSPINLVRESGYISFREQINEEQLKEALKNSPHLIEQWLSWSDSKPVPDTWRFYQKDDGSYQVWHSSEKKDSEGFITSDKFQACAGFIKRELENFTLLP